MLAAMNRRLGLLALALGGGLLAILLIARDRRTSDAVDMPEHTPVQATLEPSSDRLDPAPTPEHTAVDSAESRTVVATAPRRKRSGGTVLFGIASDQNGAPIASAALWFLSSHGGGYLTPSDRSSVIATLHTDRDGHFSTPVVGEGLYWLGIKPAHADDKVVVEARDISVAKRDDVRGLPRIESGAFPASGDTSIQPTDISTRPRSVQVSGDLERQEVNLKLFRGLYVRGRVLSPAGGPATAVIETLLLNRVAFGPNAPKGILLAEFRTDDDGLFAAGPLDPGHYQLKAKSSGTYVESEPVEAWPGDVGVELTLVQGGVIEAFIVEQDSRRPVYLADVTAYRHESDEVMPTISVGNGYLRAAGLQPGTYDLCARSEAAIAVLRGLRVERGDTAAPVTIGVSPGATVVINNKDAQHVRVCDLYVEDACIDRVDLGRGTDVSRSVPAGLVEVRYKVDESPRSITVNALVGSQVRVSVTR
jgi:hypothetical protein